MIQFFDIFNECLFDILAYVAKFIPFAACLAIIIGAVLFVLSIIKK